MLFISFSAIRSDEKAIAATWGASDQRPTRASAADQGIRPTLRRDSWICGECGEEGLTIRWSDKIVELEDWTG